MKTHKTALILLIILLLGLLHYAGLTQLLTLEYAQQNLGVFKQKIEARNAFYTAAFFIIYVVTTALSLPGAAVLTILAGALFGLIKGTLIVSFASTIGATLAFLATRTLLRDFIIKKWGQKLSAIDAGIKKEGAWYLLSLRLVPVVPFFIINLALGLTAMPAKVFYFVSQIGMLPGTFVYVNAGVALSSITNISGIVSPQIVFAFTLLGLMPLITKFFMKAVTTNRVYKKFKKPKAFDYNLVVIGGGSAGLVTAYIAAAVKAKVALIEKHKMGGDCLNTGCVPSKALIRTARFMSDIKNSKNFGVKNASADFDFTDAMSRVKSVIGKIAPHDSAERYSELGVDCIKDEAKILSPWEVQISGDKILKTKNIVIATGARPRIPNIPGIDKIPYVTSDTLWDIKQLPKKLLVVGGGPIGCELAQAFQALGSKVVIIEASEQIMGREDQDVANLIKQKFEQDGIEVITKAKINSFEKLENSNVVHAILTDKQATLDFDLALIATGREPNVKGFGLENLGIELNPNGTITTNEYLQTKYKNIFACGDVAGPYQFTHAAAHQAWFTAVNSLFGRFKKFKINYTHLPWATYTTPEVARLGLSESDAKQKAIPYEITKYGIDDLDRAIADGSDHGFVKVLTAPGKDKILGVTIVGDHASEMLPEFVTAMKYGLGLNKILGTIHTYPTMSEANKYAAGVWKKAHAPKKLLSYVQKFHQWSLK